MFVVVFFAVVFREIDDVRFGTNKPKLVWEFQWTANVFYYTTAHTLGHNWCLIYYHRDTILTFISLKHTYNTHTYLLSNAYLLDCAESIFRTNNWGGSRCCALAGGTLPERAERETLRKWGEKKENFMRYALRRIWLVDTLDRLLHLACSGLMCIACITQVPLPSTNQNASRRHLFFLSLSCSFFFPLQCHHHAKRRPVAKVVMRACFSTNFFPLFEKKKKTTLSGIIIIL